MVADHQGGWNQGRVNQSGEAVVTRTIAIHYHDEQAQFRHVEALAYRRCKFHNALFQFLRCVIFSGREPARGHGTKSLRDSGVHGLAAEH